VTAPNHEWRIVGNGGRWVVTGGVLTQGNLLVGDLWHGALVPLKEREGG